MTAQVRVIGTEAEAEEIRLALVDRFGAPRVVLAGTAPARSRWQVRVYYRVKGGGECDE